MSEMLSFFATPVKSVVSYSESSVTSGSRDTFLQGAQLLLCSCWHWEESGWKDVTFLCLSMENSWLRDGLKRMWGYGWIFLGLLTLHGQVHWFSEVNEQFASSCLTTCVCQPKFALCKPANSASHPLILSRCFLVMPTVPNTVGNNVASGLPTLL
jgi:hypothetical protein